MLAAEIVVAGWFRLDAAGPLEPPGFENWSFDRDSTEQCPSRVRTG